MRTALIDGDSILYILAWTHKDTDDEPLLTEAVDQFVRSILLATNSQQYIGALGHPTVKCFRYEAAKYKPYKANRKEKDEHMVRLEPIIQARLRGHWGFISYPGLEADDIVSLAAEMYPDVVICSPDKDLRQIPGTHYDYKKSEFAEIAPNQADYLFNYQMLVGDVTDNVAGLPGIGPKKAEEALNKTDLTVSFYEQTVREMYSKYFGNYYGNVIFEENKKVLGLLNKEGFPHPEYLEVEYIIQNAKRSAD